MKINNKQILEKMNFADFKVLNSYIDKKVKSLYFYLSGAWIMESSNKIELGEGYLKLIGYSSIFISAYHAKEKIEKILSEENYEKLQEICEIDIFQDEIVIKGFAVKTFNWIEFHVRGEIVHGQFIDKV